MKTKIKFILLYLLPSIYFNLRYLPFKQALKIPIFLYKPKFYKLSGKIEIKGKISTGMIKMGFPNVCLYPNDGVVLEIKGKIIFNGKAFFGNNSKITIGEKGLFEVGYGIKSSAAIRIICYHYIKLGDNCRFGWEVLLMDTSFHPLKDCENNNFLGKGYAPIIIGNNNWLASKVIVMSGVETPNYCIIGARSLVTKKIDAPEYSLLAGSPPKIIRTGVYRDISDDMCEYEYYK